MPGKPLDLGPGHVAQPVESVGKGGFLFPGTSAETIITFEIFQAEDRPLMIRRADRPGEGQDDVFAALQTLRFAEVRGSAWLYFCPSTNWVLEVVPHEFAGNHLVRAGQLPWGLGMRHVHQSRR